MTVSSPSSATAAAASPVVAATTAVAHGIDARSFRHWSSATACERISRTSSSATDAGPTRQCRIGRIASATIESAES